MPMRTRRKEEVCVCVWVCVYACVYKRTYGVYTYIIPLAIMHSPFLTWNTSPCKFRQVSSSIKVDNSKREVHHMAAEGAQESGE